MQAYGTVDGLLGSYMAMDRTHPHLAVRVMHLLQWIEHGNYLNILSGQYTREKARKGPTRTKPKSSSTDGRAAL
jgi:hypothetical protein